MKVTKKLCLVILIFMGFHIFSQNSGTYDQIVNFIHQKHPEINTENKLIALCVWSSDNAESRETNKEYNRLYHVYQEAILKDARKGMVYVSIASDKDEVTYHITLQKDGIKDCIIYADFKGNDADGIIKSLKLNNASNVVYSGKGELFFKDLDKTNLQSSFITLVTR